MTEESDRKPYYGDTLQPWDLIKAMGIGPEFCAGNVIKYVGRYKTKNGLDDLKKARWYLDRLIESVEATIARPDDKRPRPRVRKAR